MDGRKARPIHQITRGVRMNAFTGHHPSDNQRFPLETFTVCASVRQGRCLVARALAPGCSDSRWIDQIIDHSTAELDLFSRSLSPSTVFIYLFIYYVYIQQRQHQWVYRSCCYRFDPSPSRVTRADASSHPEKILKEKKRINGGKHNDRDGKLVRRRGHTHAVYTKKYKKTTEATDV